MISLLKSILVIIHETVTIKKKKIKVYTDLIFRVRLFVLNQIKNKYMKEKQISY